MARKNFKPGDKVLVKAHTVGCYPLAPCTIIRKMVDEPQTCHICGQEWPGHNPTYYTKNPSYLVEHEETGAQGIYQADRIKARAA